MRTARVPVSFSRSMGRAFPGAGLLRLLASAALIGCAAAMIHGLAGCSPKKTLLGNLPPETTLFLSGPIDSVSHRVHIYWFGSDVDGSVVAYRMRFVYPPPARQDPKWDTLYCALPGRCTDSLFTMFTGDSTVVSPRFEIASIDDDGALDPTPAAQTFLLTNLAPRVTIATPYAASDSTYASLTLSWTVDDPDGGGPGLHYRIWLNGNEAAYDSTSEESFTVPSSRFLDANGTFTSGPRTVYVQAVDDGGLSGPPATMTWFVRAPAATLAPDHRGELLVIDEIPSSSSINSVFDQFFVTAIGTQLTSDRYSVLRPQFNPRVFRSARDFAQTLRQFKAVVWYRGLETGVSTLLMTYQDSLGAYLDAGGSLYLDGLYLTQGLNSQGALTEAFLPHLHVTRQIYNFNGTLADSTVGWGNTGGLRTGTLFRSSIYGDTVRATIGAPSIPPPGTPGIRGFQVSDTSEVALWALSGQLVPANVGFDVPVGVSLTHNGGGQLVLLSLPLRVGFPVPAARLAPRMLFGYGNVPGVIRPSPPLIGER